MVTVVSPRDLGLWDPFQMAVPGLTLWKINMEPENDGLEDDFPFQMGDLEAPC